MKKDIPKRKMSLLFFLKSLSNKLQLFFMSQALKTFYSHSGYGLFQM